MQWRDELIGEMEAGGVRRRLTELQPVSPVEGILDGRLVTLFSTNDYFGLSQHPRVVEAVREAVDMFGMGPRGAALMCAYTDRHRMLEDALARLKRAESCLLFPAGYMANIGLLQAFGGDDCEIFSDELNHASIVDGCRLSRSSVRIYKHCDANDLELKLRGSRSKRKLIVTEALFSMDGDKAPLDEIVALKERFGAMLAVDEAHSTLVLGPSGGGLAEALGLSERVELQMGTLSKAFGALGGYVAMRRKLREIVVNRARSFMFATALPVPVVAAALAAIDVHRTDAKLRDSLRRNVATAAERLGHPNASDSPIFPIIIGDAGRTAEIAGELLSHGFHVPAIRPPTVPQGTSRLRVTVSAAHTTRMIEGLCSALEGLVPTEVHV